MAHLGHLLTGTVIFLVTLANAQSRQSDPYDNLNDLAPFELSKPDLAIFVLSALFALVFFGQLLACVRYLNRRCPKVDFPRRTPFGFLIFLSIASLTVGSGLFAWAWANDRQLQRFLEPLAPVVYAFIDFLPRFADITLLAALILLLRQRRDDFVNDNQFTNAPPSDPGKTAANWIFYRFAPFVMFAMMLVASLTRLALFILGVDTDEKLQAVDAMAHVYLTFLILLTFTIALLGFVLWSRANRIQSPTHADYDKYVLDRIVKLIIPAIVIRAIFELITHICLYDENIALRIDWLSLQIATIIILGLIFCWIFYAAMQLGMYQVPGVWRSRRYY